MSTSGHLPIFGFSVGSLFHYIMRNYHLVVEWLLHLIFWVFIFASINVDWTADWFDSDLRPNTPAPLSLIMFGVCFYLFTYLLLPKYFNIRRWKMFALQAIGLMLIPELLRILMYGIFLDYSSFQHELIGRDSFIFGSPSPFFFALTASFFYRFTKDKLFTNEAFTLSSSGKSSLPSASDDQPHLLSADEAHDFEQKLSKLLKADQVYLNPDLTLKDLATALQSNENKVSHLLNYYLQSGFYDFINRARVEHFKREAARPGNDHLSIVGLALSCGFSSKSSFYRAFKKEMSISPSQYLKSLKQKYQA